MEKIQYRKRQEPKSSPSSRYCSHHEYEIAKRGYEHYLRCRKCQRFYGYIKRDKDDEFYRRVQKQNGIIDLDTIKWLVTDYTQTTDNQRTKKEPRYDPRKDELRCKNCGHPFFGAQCTQCGKKREVRKTDGRKRR